MHLIFLPVQSSHYITEPHNHQTVLMEEQQAKPLSFNKNGRNTETEKEYNLMAIRILNLEVFLL